MRRPLFAAWIGCAAVGAVWLATREPSGSRAVTPAPARSPGVPAEREGSIPEIERAAEALQTRAPAAAADPRETPAPGGPLRGRVVDRDGAPVAGATVGICPNYTNELRFEHVTFTTDADGRFAGDPDVTQWYLVGARAEGRCLAFVGPLAGFGQAHEVELALGQGASVAGMVLDELGTPAEGARVELFASLGREQVPADVSPAVRYLAQLVPVGEVRAGPGGSFHLAGVPAGVELRLVAHAEEGAARAVLEHVPAPASDLRLVLRAPQRVALEVVDDRGAPVAGARVRAEPLDPGAGKPRTRDPLAAEHEVRDGAVALGPGLWHLSASAPGHGPRAELRTLVPRDEPLRVVLRRQARLEVRVRDARGAPVAQAPVALHRDFDRGNAGWTKPTDAAGVATYEAADAIRWHVVVGPGESATRADVDLAPGSTRVLELALDAAGSLEVLVLDASGAPLPERAVELHGHEQREVRTDAQGRARFDGLAAGTYLVLAITAGEEARHSIDSRMESLVLAEVELAEGEPRALTLRDDGLRPVTVRGRVTRGGQPLEDARVGFVRDGGLPFESEDGEETNRRGEFRAKLLRPGLTLFVIAPPPGAGERAVRSVVVPAVEDFLLEIALPAARIAGRVLDPEGAPATEVVVHLWPLAPGPLASFAPTRPMSAEAPLGTFAFEGLADGAYRLQATSAAGGSATADIAVAGADPSEVELRLGAGFARTVRAVDPHGAPVAGARIWVLADGAGLGPDAQATTDAEGRAAPSCEAGVEGVLATHGWLAGAAALAPQSSEETTIQLAPGGTLLVRHVDERGAPRMGACRVLDEAGRDWALAARALPPREQATLRLVRLSQERFAPLPPGRYTLVQSGEAASVTVHAGEVSEVTLTAR